MLKIIKNKKHYLIIYLLFSIIFSINVQAIEVNKDLKVKKGYLDGLKKVHVKKVIDGDTIVVTGGNTIRLIGIDTPEYKESFFAKTAAGYTEDILLAKDIYIEQGKDKYDRHGRMLAYVYLENGKLFNALILKKGYGSIMMVYPNIKFSDLFRKMAAEARDNEKGLWEDLPILSWKNAIDYKDKLAIIRGKIKNTYNSGQAVFLNFDQEYWHTFSAVIFSDDLASFYNKPSKYYLNKKVRIMGKIREYKGAAEIIVELPEQIKICR